MGTYDFNSWSFGLNFDFTSSGQYIPREPDPVVELCEKEAIGYFSKMGIDLLSKRSRQRLNEETKLRVKGFLENRYKYYETNGFVV